MVSKIRSESGLKNLVDELKNKNENNKLKKEYSIDIYFEQSNSKKMKFINNFIFNNFKDDISQIFINNLNCNNKMTLTDILTKDIIKILEKIKMN